jgi:Amt family ammonium transporter
MSPHFDQWPSLAWILLCGFLVMFMQAGFALIETGFCRAKNAVNTIAMNLLIYPVAVLGFWLVGYGLMMGGMHGWPALGNAVSDAREISLHVGHHSLGLLGWSKFALLNMTDDPINLVMFMFSAVFLDTAATIPTGAMAERWKFLSFMLYGLFISMWLYPLYGNWVWGGGWLATLGLTAGLGHGHVDFAGSSVVHLTGGVTALAGVIVLGPRMGKYRHDGTTAAMPGHNLPMAVLGTFILAFGWFGFNAGSSLSATDPRIAAIAVNTMLASCAGALSALLYVWGTARRPEIGMACNGLLGGLVAITASCAFVSAAAAVLIGAAAGLFVVWSVVLLERRFKIDDPVGAISVHGTCGLWGALALGLFADGSYGAGWNGVAEPVRGLLFGDPWQLVAQLIGVTANIAFVFSLSYVFFRLLDRLIGNRVTAEAEQAGLDIYEMGSGAYSGH